MAAPRAKTKAETEFSYFDKVKNKVVRFTPKVDEVVATFRRISEPREAVDHDARNVTKATSLPVSRPINYERGFAVFSTARPTDANAAPALLGSQPAIANTISVMTDEDGNTRYILPDELTVQFKPDVSASEAEGIIQSLGSTIVARQRTPGYYTVSVPPGKGLFESIQAFSASDRVRFAETSEAGFDDALDYFPDDPEFFLLWGLHNTGQSGGTPNADIDAPQAWQLERGDANVIVAVIDTGADMDHPDLQANILPRGTEDWDFADAGDPDPEDPDGHGTHVCGTAAAVDNTTGVIGVAHNCRIMPLRINLVAGMNQNRADAINYVTAQALANPQRRYVINGSWKMSGNMTAVELAVHSAEANNVVLVFAAGNTNQGAVTFPARYPETIAVANTDHQDRVASTSAVGPEVDVCAPGTSIRSTWLSGGYAYNSGTSMACPHVAGLAALIWSRNLTLTNHDVRSIIESTCDNIDAMNPGLMGQIGRGRIDAFQALMATPLQADFYRSFGFPQANQGTSSGLAFAPDFRSNGAVGPALLFLTQQPFSEYIYYLDPATGGILGRVDPAGNDTIGCLEWDGALIRVANVSRTGWINSIDPNTGNQVASLFVPSGRGEGLATDRTRLFYSTETKIHVIHLASGSLIESFPAPEGSCRSLAYGRGYLFCGNSAAGRVIVYDVSNHQVFGTIPVPGSGANKVEGLGFDAATSELYVANQSENRIYVGRISL